MIMLFFGPAMKWYNNSMVILCDNLVYLVYEYVLLWLFYCMTVSFYITIM